MAKGTIYNELPFPLKGVNIASGFTHQPRGTVYDAKNVRSFDPTTNANRGAQRCGHSKYLPGTLNSGHAIQNINHLMSAGTIVPSSGTSFRTLTGVAVAGGTVKTFVRGGSYTAVTNGTTALDTTNPYIGSTVLLNKLYYADGVHWKYYDPTTNTVTAMTASAGSLPVDLSGNAPRLIMTWRGRLVYSGLIGDPQNWFMSRQFAPLDWDYSPAITDATMAVAGNNTEAGLIPDLVTTMIPYSDDLAIFGGDHSMWQMTEDPAAGGQIDRISDTVGMAWGDSWCKDAEGNVWFIGSRGGLYVFRPTPGATAAPVRVSAQSVDESLLTIDFSKNIVRMVWDDRFQSVMFYITPISGASLTITESQPGISDSTFSAQISVTADDGYWGQISTFNNSANSLTAQNSTVAHPAEVLNGFFHFPNVTIAQGTTIRSASLSLRAAATQSNAQLLIVTGDLEGNPSAIFSSADGNSRVWTSAAVSWTTTLVSGTDYTSPDISAVIQELVNQGSFSSGNAVQIRLANPSGDPSPIAQFVAEDGTHPAGRATLAVHYGSVPQNEIWHISNTGTGGTFTLTLSAQTTGAIAFDATAATLKTAIESAFTLSLTTVTVTGSGTGADPWVVTVTNPADTAIGPPTGDGTLLTGGSGTTNWVYDTRNEAFWPDQFANSVHQPTAVHLMDGDNPNDRVVLLGSADSSIRFIDLSAKDDDGTAISSHVKLGPVQAQGSKLRINELVAVLGESSDSCTLDIYAGHSAEAAFNSATSRFTRTLSAGRSEAIRPATTGQALFLKISNSTLDKAWQFEALFAVLEGLGRQAARQL